MFDSDYLKLYAKKTRRTYTPEAHTSRVVHTKWNPASVYALGCIRSSEFQKSFTRGRSPLRWYDWSSCRDKVFCSWHGDVVNSVRAGSCSLWRSELVRKRHTALAEQSSPLQISFGRVSQSFLSCLFRIPTTFNLFVSLTYASVHWLSYLSVNLVTGRTNGESVCSDCYFRCYNLPAISTPLDTGA